MTITESALDKGKTFMAVALLTVALLGALAAALATADFNFNIPSGIH